VNRNRKFDVSTAPTKAKSREPAYSQRFIQNKTDRQWVKIQIVRQSNRSDGYGGRCFELRRGKEVGRREDELVVEAQCFQFRVKELWRDSKG